MKLTPVQTNSICQPTRIYSLMLGINTLHVFLRFFAMVGKGLRTYVLYYNIIYKQTIETWCITNGALLVFMYYNFYDNVRIAVKKWTSKVQSTKISNMKVHNYASNVHMKTCTLQVCRYACFDKILGIM